MKPERHETPKGRVVIAGGTGFLGQNLARHLVNLAWDVVVMSRHTIEDEAHWRHATWDARTVGDWVHHLDGATAIVNLAGRTVDCVKTPDHCDEILRSRVESTEVLGRALESVQTLPRVWVQMSTAHIYGDPPELVCDEDSPFGYGLGAVNWPRMGPGFCGRRAGVYAAGRLAYQLRTGKEWRRVEATQ